MKIYLKKALCVGLLFFCSSLQVNAQDSVIEQVDKEDEFELLIPTFLGNEQRNFYGTNAPDHLNLKWKHYLGEGITVISRKLGERKWKGAGWTGQPLIVKHDQDTFLIIGAYDHHLKKIKARDGKLVWQYKYDDVIKGTGTIWDNSNAVDPKNRLVILQGSRLGTHHFLDAKHVPSYRAISFLTGEELWRLDVKFTPSYSRDVDGSALIINDTVYIGLENALFTVLDPDYKQASEKDGMLQPRIFEEHKLYDWEDVVKHKNNIVTESSPSRIGDFLFIASGSGHVYRYNLRSREIDWDYYIGSDIDGSAVVTKDSCILVSVEKQYIKGQGGVFKLDPFKPADSNCVVWYSPTENKELNSWEGGVIGSVGVNDAYLKDELDARLAAFVGIDGYLYVVKHNACSDSLVLGPDSTSYYRSPEICFKKKIGASISTPVFVDDKLIVCGYGGIHMFRYDKFCNFDLIDHKAIYSESTPVVLNNRIYIPSRDGYLYCLGD